MSYCSKCGQKNDDEAKFCNKCGASLTGSKKDFEQEWEDRCDEECSGKKHGGPPIIWGIIVIIIGLWILIEFGLKNIEGLYLPAWIENFNLWWVFALLIAIVIIISGIRIIIRK